MFLNALPKTEAECPPGTNIYDDSCVLEGSGFQTVFRPTGLGLLDKNVDYYGFLTSDEFKAIQDYLIGYMAMDTYYSPYFGQGSGAYRELDKVYEAYRQRFVGLDDIRQPVTVISDLKRTDASAGISPMLILAAAAAAFFIGG